jgi:hypothetical protein
MIQHQLLLSEGRDRLGLGRPPTVGARRFFNPLLIGATGSDCGNCEACAIFCKMLIQTEEKRSVDAYLFTMTSKKH